MIGDLVAAVEIEAVALAPGLALLVPGPDDFQQAVEALEVRRAAGGEIQDDIAARRLRAPYLLAADQHRRIRRERFVRRAMRHEADRRPGPQHPVDAAPPLPLPGGEEA